MDIKRVNIIVLDSVGIGALPDAADFGDKGAATIQNTAKELGGLELPNLEKLGLGNIEEIEGVKAVDNPQAAFGKMAEESNGKDTTTGHWEISGITSEDPFPTFPEGFPSEIMDQFHQAIGTESLANRPASGTVIINELGEEHMKTGKPIVYTSADSVFQIAAHEDIISVDELYEMCEKARVILQGEFAVARVIARPFIGEVNNFERTANRKDFSLKPPKKMILNNLKDAGYDVMAVGKIDYIFAGEGITDSVHTKSNMDGVDKTLDYLKNNKEGLIFSNLVDFDSKYGHRRNPQDYGQALENFDKRLPEIINSLDEDDILIITADHGCDPTYKGTDHTREYVPLLVYGQQLKAGYNLGIRSTFSDIAATIAEIFNVDNIGNGTSFLNEITE